MVETGIIGHFIDQDLAKDEIITVYGHPGFRPAVLANFPEIIINIPVRFPGEDKIIK
jgi:hypothetical protein